MFFFLKSPCPFRAFVLTRMIHFCLRLIFSNICMNAPWMKSKVYLRFILIWNLWGSTTEEKMGFRAPFYIQDWQRRVQQKNACQFEACAAPHNSSKRNNRDICTWRRSSYLHYIVIICTTTWLDPKMLTYWRLTFSESGSCRTHMLSQIISNHNKFTKVIA